MQGSGISTRLVSAAFLTVFDSSKCDYGHSKSSVVQVTVSIVRRVVHTGVAQ